MSVPAPVLPTVPESIAFLSCGQQVGVATDFSDAMQNVSKSVVAIAKTLQAVNGRGGEEVGIVAPYLARSLMEVGLTGVLGRLDPFRILSLRRVQMSPDYDLNRRALSAMQWFGDVQTKEAQAKWDPDKSASSFSRALLDGCWNEVAWTKAFERALLSTGGATSDWLIELRAVEPEKFVALVRGRLIATYSALSKGVHNEIVVDRDVVFDPATISELISAAVKYMSFVCFVSHFIDHSSCSLKPMDALVNFQAVNAAEFT